jgi:hypothetical protein
MSPSRVWSLTWERTSNVVTTDTSNPSAALIGQHNGVRDADLAVQVGVAAADNNTATAEW